MTKAKVIALKMAWYLILVLAFLCPIAIGVRILLLRNLWFTVGYVYSPLICYGLFYLALYFLHVRIANQKNITEPPPKTKNSKMAAIPETISPTDALANIDKKQYMLNPADNIPNPVNTKKAIRYSFVTIPYRFTCMFLARMYHKRIGESTKRKRYLIIVGALLRVRQIINLNEEENDARGYHRFAQQGS